MIAANLRGSAAQILAASIVLVFTVDGRISSIGGPLTWWHFLWLAAQTAIAASFVIVARRWPAGVDDERLSRRRVYGALYFASGALWGAYTWVAIVPGQIFNQVFVMLVIVSLSLVYVVRLAACSRVLMAAYAGLFLVALPNTWLEENALSKALFYLAPFWVAFLLHAAGQLSRQINEVIVMRLREHALAASLSEARARAAAASASKSAFLANMSHELRTPLNAIIGFSDLMRSGTFGELSVRYRGYADDIHASGAHLLSLINDVLDISKIEAGGMELSPETMSPGDIGAQVMRLLKPRADERNQSLTLSLSEAPALMIADPRAVTQILLNVVGNAVKYSGAGAAIVLEIRAENRDVVLMVSDNGPGIPTERQARLFRPFERLDNSYLAGDGGTGLGLSLVRALAALHGGEAAIDSRLGKGTTVSVRLPGAATATARAA